MTEQQKHLLSTEFSWVKTDDPQFSSALNSILNSKDNLTIVGAGGSGKSVLLKVAAKLLDGNTVVLSTTGISAANLAGDGIVTTTLHSFFRLPPLTIIDNPILYQDLSLLMQGIDTILIDEVSMLNASITDTVLKLLKKYRAFEEEKLPRIIMFGDVLQLPPVVDDADSTVKALFERKYNGNYMFFNAEEYKLLDSKVIHLNHIYRQSDSDWKAVLNRMRVGATTASDLSIINSRVVDERRFINAHKTMMYLAATNKRVQALNDFYLDSDNSHTYKATIEGAYDLKGTAHKLSVEIAPDMQVMCTKNSKKEGYQNGTLGRVLRTHKNYVTVETASGIVNVYYDTWEQYKYTYDRASDSVSHAVTGRFTQIACTPAFAVTVHKSQSLTLDAMMLDPTGLAYMSPGLAYVALSRCTTLNGIGLAHKINMSDIKVSREGLMFLENNGGV